MMIFLIGFMGSGKTSIGKRLAELLNFEFIDLDELIEKSEGKTISQIFLEHGEEYFRKKESSALQSLYEKKNIVIATGGGTPCFHDNMKWMNSNGTTIYLKASPEVLYDRLKNESAHRPLLKNYSDDELKKFIDLKVRDRAPFYNSSQVVFDTGMMSVEETVRKVYDRL